MESINEPTPRYRKEDTSQDSRERTKTKDQFNASLKLKRDEKEDTGQEITIHQVPRLSINFTKARKKSTTAATASLVDIENMFDLNVLTTSVRGESTEGMNNINITPNFVNKYNLLPKEFNSISNKNKMLTNKV